MSGDQEVVEILLVVDDPRYIDAVTDAANLLGKVTKSTAKGWVDVSSILSRPPAMLVRSSRDDFDAASGALGEILSGLRDTWGACARIIIENKRPDQVASIPITRHLIALKFVRLNDTESVFRYVKAELVRRGGTIVSEDMFEIIYANKAGRKSSINIGGLSKLADRAMRLNEYQQAELFDGVFTTIEGNDGFGGAAGSVA